MKWLKQKEVEVILSSLAELNADLNIETLPGRLFDLVNKLISNDVISFDSFDDKDKFSFNNWSTRPDIISPQKLKIFSRFADQHVLIPKVVGQKSRVALKVTDFITQKEFEKTELFNEYYRETPFRYQMGIALPIFNDLTITCGVNRKRKDFTERDKAVLTLLGPYLSNTIRNSFAYRRLTIISTDKELGFAIINKSGKASYLDTQAKLFLKKYFSGVRLTNNLLPEILQSWVEKQLLLREVEATFMPLPPLKVESGNSELTLRLLRNNTNDPYTLLFEENLSVRAKLKKHLSLTTRQTEILFWIVQGKSNQEIAKILNISPRTVQKHIQQIYDKMGVENRRAAISQALDVL